MNNDPKYMSIYRIFFCLYTTKKKTYFQYHKYEKANVYVIYGIENSPIS